MPSSSSGTRCSSHTGDGVTRLAPVAGTAGGREHAASNAIAPNAASKRRNGLVDLRVVDIRPHFRFLSHRPSRPPRIANERPATPSAGGAFGCTVLGFARG